MWLQVAVVEEINSNEFLLLYAQAVLEAMHDFQVSGPAHHHGTSIKAVLGCLSRLLGSKSCCAASSHRQVPCNKHQSCQCIEERGCRWQDM